MLILFVSCKMPFEKNPPSEDTSRILSFLVSSSSGSNADNQTNNPETASLNLGGTVTGMQLNSTLLVQNNFAELLQITMNGSFVFTKKYKPNTPYAVTVFQNPSGLSCSVINGVGEISSVSYLGIIIQCITL